MIISFFIKKGVDTTNVRKIIYLIIASGSDLSSRPLLIGEEAEDVVNFDCFSMF